MNIAEEVKALIAERQASRRHAQELTERIAALESAAQRVEHHHVLPRSGIDYAFPPHPPASKLHSAGFSFVMRYLTDPSQQGKALSSGEAHELSHNGIDIGAIFEEGARNSEEGYNAGTRDSLRALHALNALHPKGNPPIYFVCDFDAYGEGKVNEVLEYIRGAVHTIGWYRVGLYAGYEVVRQAHAESRCKFLWQTYAWSHGAWLPEAQLRQVQNGVTIFGADCDIDKAVAADFGQFRV
jgi:Domain of unknown function (DUF1906)